MIEFHIGLLLGCVLGAGVMAKVFKSELEHIAEITKDITATEFAARLKEKVQKPEYPWEDWFVCEEDIDEVLEEMVVESNCLVQ